MSVPSSGQTRPDGRLRDSRRTAVLAIVTAALDWTDEANQSPTPGLSQYIDDLTAHLTDLVEDRR